jgi:hypothetical protein
MSSPIETVVPPAAPSAPPSPVQNGVPAVAPPEVLPNLDEIVIEDGLPVDSIFAEKQQRLLTEPLYSGWTGPGPGRTFQAFANVGLFYGQSNSLSPDVMLALDIPTGGDLALRKNRSYFIWERLKPPDVAIELVSDRRGREEDFKLHQYALLGVSYYVIFDPLDRLHHGILRCFASRAGTYEPLPEARFARIGLGLVLWEGEFEGYHARWLRWCDDQGQIIPTGQELADQESQRAEQERQRAEQERQRAEQERKRVEQLEAKLRSLGIDPHQV